MITHIDHLVLTVRSIDKTCQFYERALGFERETMPNGRTALRFGKCKLNLHQADHIFDPRAYAPTAGSADFCLVTDDTLEQVAGKVHSAGFEIESGPVARTGALGAMESVYIRDPDANLIEVSRYRNAAV
ncbi:VOC family protein [Silvibacterium acidisoli]|uniref:VOC family protein n=1 Tax=Acidobacteriaceae bacterium ZG23-2 TaxID=2883246 RepID=UPI00406C0D88